ncbi:hypothetical protein D6745_01560 [Candidatus Woesearchaeota archaeon]|nr:MAG: hypothetical protein D6745_01560 [Candidatus Woesearchaeota archaeon]
MNHKALFVTLIFAFLMMSGFNRGGLNVGRVYGNSLNDEFEILVNSHSVSRNFEDMSMRVYIPELDLVFPRRMFRFSSHDCCNGDKRLSTHFFSYDKKKTPDCFHVRISLRDRRSSKRDVDYALVCL